jgi:uncharacterized protein (DUF1015 family)
MAVIQPFRGLRYNPSKFCDLSDVITAPYDRIHEAEQAEYYEQSPYNIVRIIQGRKTADDTANNNVYTRAQAYMRNWIAEEVLIRDPEPTLYVLEQRFTTPDGIAHLRRGLTAALKLTSFDEGVVLPHEHTLQGPKVDRLNLTQATETAWGHIFMLYPDPQATINSLLQPFLDAHMPAIVCDRVIEPDVEQNFWVVHDPELMAQVSEAMEAIQPLIIADGHHRYETALNYRSMMREQHPDAPSEAAYNYVLVTLVSMDDPGLVVLPTHRLIHSYTAMDSRAVLSALEAHFSIEDLSSLGELQDALDQAVPEHPRYGFYDGDYHLLTLRSLDTMVDLLPDREHSFRTLDVTILHELVIEKTMGLSKQSVQNRENIDYLRDALPGLTAVDEGKANFLFLLNPTRMGQVRDCTLAGERMPQKSTDFFPKVVSGLVALPLSDTLQA